MDGSKSLKNFRNILVKQNIKLLIFVDAVKSVLSGKFIALNAYN